VGAGPGGLVCGEYAAKKGVSVLIIDRKREIGLPVRCAEVIGTLSFEILGLDVKSDFVMNTINRAQLISPKGKILDVYVPYEEFTLYVIDRSLFEKELANRLKRADGEIMLGTTVLKMKKDKGKFTGVKTTQGDITGKIIIGADGVESKVGKWCGLAKNLRSNEIFSCAQHTLVDMEGIDDHFEIHFGSKFTPGGYAWMFPKGKSEANLGLGVLASYNEKPIKLLEKFKNSRAKDAHSTRLIAGCTPSTLPLPKTVKENIILVGDSARQTNAVSGGGIANAVLAGKIAGELAGEVVMEKKPISHLLAYESLWRGHLEKLLIKKFNQRKYLEDDAKNERLITMLRFAALFKPIIPKSLIVRWLRPNF